MSMRCPHCRAASKARVLESRPAGADIWRRRQCGACGRTFVSRETAAAELRMPAETRSIHRCQTMRDRLAKPEERGPRGDGAHLQGVWG